MVQDGESIYVAAMGMDPGAKVVTVDVETCVGVIHVIDAVLLPTGMSPSLSRVLVFMHWYGQV